MPAATIQHRCSPGNFEGGGVVPLRASDAYYLRPAVTRRIIFPHILKEVTVIACAQVAVAGDAEADGP